MISAQYVRTIALLLLTSITAVSFTGCGGNSEQRVSGTLAKPIDIVEKAGEVQGKEADAKKSTAIKK